MGNPYLTIKASTDIRFQGLNLYRPVLYQTTSFKCTFATLLKERKENFEPERHGHGLL